MSDTNVLDYLREQFARLNCDMASDVKIIKWMLGALYAPVIAILLKLFLG